MDIVRIRGGLGNQMFQYAFAEALRSYGREVACSLGFYRKCPNAMRFCLEQVFPNIELNEIDDDTFNSIDNKWIQIKQNKTDLDKFLVDYENRFFWVEEIKYRSRFDENIFRTKNCVFVGYWQTEKYFKNIADEIRKIYTFQCAEDELIQLSDQLRNNYYSIHIRRGDYLNNKSFEGICTEEYYKKAIDYIYSKNGKAQFIFFSDDIKWIKHNFQLSGAIYCEDSLFEHYQDWYDMYLMSKCCGNIIANSSFSWWGAWLNENPNKIVIAPKRWHNAYDAPDICPEEWVRINVEGEIVQ